MKTKINDAIKQVLQQFGEKYFIGEVLNKNKVIQDLDTYDQDLLEAFISNETLKSNFTIDIAGNTVMQTNKLIELFEADEYWQDSYTKYSKKIGLTAGGKFIDESTDVVLDFPYKDTVLKASMSKEDTDKDALRPDEPFLNEVIAKEEIDVLIDKKVLVNAKKYDEDGEHEVDSFSEDDNLIMKGNNLLALHTIQERYRNKVKLVYLDPPYYFLNNTDDTFAYNSDFKLSTWLVFMKNRIELTLDLLKEDGYLVIQMNDYGVFHLKVLLDEIFRNNTAGGFVNHISVKMSDLSGPKMAHVNKKIPKIKEHLLIYAKNYDHSSLNPLRESSNWDSAIDAKRYTSFVDMNGKDNPEEWEYTTVRKKLQSLGMEYGSKEAYKFLMENDDKVFRTAANPALTKLSKKNKFNRNIFTPVTTSTGLKKYVYKDEEVIFASSKIEVIDGIRTPTESISDIWLNIALNDLSNEGGGVDLDNGKKPEALLKRIIEATTNEGDIVLDYFMGTATTQATALKLKRRFIGIEQMDYILDKSVQRLINTISGEKRGISKNINWQGGGSFVYVELMEKNRGFLKAIRDAETQTELHKVFDFMLKEAEIDFRVDLEAIKDSLHELTFEDQKKTLIKIIDKNQLYYNYSEIDDENVRDLISDSDYELNKNFYDEGGE